MNKVGLIRKILNAVLSIFELRIVRTSNLEDEIKDLEFYRKIYMLRLNDDMREFKSLSENILGTTEESEK